MMQHASGLHMREIDGVSAVTGTEVLHRRNTHSHGYLGSSSPDAAWLIITRPKCQSEGVLTRE